MDDTSDSDSNPPVNSSNASPKQTSGMLKVAVVAIAAAAFFAGYSAGTFTDSGDGISEEQIDVILSRIDSKLVVPTEEDARDGPQKIHVSLDDDPMKGNPNADITIVEFSDFQCPFCSRFYEQTLPLIEQAYIDTGKVNFVYRDFPLQIHQNAVPVHIAAECADEQGGFWPYHDILFENQREWQSLPAEALSEQLVQYAVGLELEADMFESCLGSTALGEEIRKDYQDGVQYGVRGTPAFFVGNESDGYVLLSGAQPFEAFQRVIGSGLG